MVFESAIIDGIAFDGTKMSTGNRTTIIGVHGIMYTCVPVLIALGPTGISTQCARLEDDINAVCGQDTGFPPATNFLKHIQSLNKQQGLGFVS